MNHSGLNRHSLRFRAVSAFTALTILVQSLAWSIYAVIISSAITTPFSMAYAFQEDELLNELKTKYKLADPTKNYNGTELLDKLTAQEVEQSGRNIEAEMINKHFVNPPEKAAPKDMSKYYDPERSFQTKMTGHFDKLQSSTILATPPSIGPNNSINLNLRANKTIKIERDVNGAIVFQEDENGNIDGVVDSTRPSVSLLQDEIASAEYNHTQTRNDASSLETDGDKFKSNNFANEDEYYIKGKEQLSSVQAGTTSNALAYKTLLRSSESNPAPKIAVDNPILTESINALRDARDGEGTWGQSCEEITTSTSTEKHLAIWETKKCASPNRENLDSCRVEREFNFPVTIADLRGSWPSQPEITIVSNTKISIKFNGVDNDTIDARFYNEEYGLNIFRKHDCRVLDKKMVLDISPDYNLVSAKRNGGSVDDLFREFINGVQTFEYRVDGFSSHTNYWANIPAEDKAFPAHFYQGFPVDAYLMYTSGQATSGFPDCEKDAGSIPTSIITNQVQVIDGKIEIEFLHGIGGHGELAIEYILEFDKPITSSVEYTQTPLGCADAVGWEPSLSVSNSGLKSWGQCMSTGPNIGDGSYDPIASCASRLCANTFNSDLALCGGTIDVFDAGYCTYDNGSNETGGVTCVDRGTVIGEVESQFCTMSEWSCVAADSMGLSNSILATIPPMYVGDNNKVCTEMNASDYRCEPLEQTDICETLSDGSQRCYSWQDIQDQPDQCAPYKDDDMCYETGRECAEGWLDDKSGTCHMWSYEYSCDIGPTVVTTDVDTTNICAGALPCLGGDCDLGEDEKNDDFAQAAAYSEMLNYMSTDTSCVDPEDPSTCTIFDGDKRFCSWDLTGMGNNCCEAPAGVNFMDYLVAANSMNKMALATNPAYEKWMTETTSSAWDALAEPITDGFNNYLYEPITSAAESIASDLGLKATEKVAQSALTDEAKQTATEALGEASTGIFAGIQQQAMRATNDFLIDTFGEEIASFFFEEVAKDSASEAAGQMVLGEGASQAASFMGYIMWAYMVYQLIKLALTIITACEEEEMDMGMMILQRQCFEIGDKYCSKKALGVCIMKRQDHCCYTSMLARIIMEQAYPMMGKDPIVEECAGISITEVGDLDWDAINLDEWIAAMVASGIMLDEDCINDECLNDRNNNVHEFAVTTDEKLDIYTTQAWAERAKEIRANTKAEDMDCSIVPQPIACKLQINP